MVLSRRLVDISSLGRFFSWNILFIDNAKDHIVHDCFPYKLPVNLRFFFNCPFSMDTDNGKALNKFKFATEREIHEEELVEN